MKKQALWFLLLWLVGITAVSAQEPNRAALVVRLEDGQAVSRCVEFTEAEISGYELLNRSGLGVETDVVGMGATVCRIEGQGCPANDCFCQCKGGGDCLYWSYWMMQDGQWQYAQAGASSYRVQNGDVQGWSWGIGTPNEAVEPPTMTFDEICSVEVVAPTAAAIPAATAQDTPQSAALTPKNWLSYALLAAIIIGLGSMLAIRRQRG